MDNIDMIALASLMCTVIGSLALVWVHLSNITNDSSLNMLNTIHYTNLAIIPEQI